MRTREKFQDRDLCGLGWLLAALPVLVLYFILFRNSVNLPEMDDYDAVLGFMNGFVSSHGFLGHLSFFCASQHGEYKLFFEHAVFVAEWVLTGHLNFVFLQQFGNMFLLLIALALWLLFRPSNARFPDRLLLFTPVVFLLFAPQYGDTLNWAMGALQNLPVLLFALLSLYLLQADRGAAFAAACACLAGAVASSGNGFFLAAVAALFLLQQRRFARLALWITVTLCVAVPYAYHYQRHPTPPLPGVPHQLLVNLEFPFAFLGAAVLRPHYAVFIGVVLTAIVLAFFAKGWRQRDPATFFAVLFIFVTALGVDETRHGFGIYGAIVSRYRIYSQLLIVLVYLSCLNLGFDRLLRPVQRRVALVSFAACTVIYCGLSDRMVVPMLHFRMQKIEEHYAAWLVAPAQVSLVPDEDLNLHTPFMTRMRARAVVNMRRSEELGIYQPPKVLSDPPVPVTPAPRE